MKTRFNQIIYTLAMVLALTSCVTTPRTAENYVAEEQWIKAVLEYRKQYASNPNDIELKSRLKQLELKAADHFYQLGLKKFAQGDLNGAIALYRQGLIAKPDHTKLIHATEDTIAIREAKSLYREADSFMKAGRTERAVELYKKVLDVYPGHKLAKKALTDYQNQRETKLSNELALSSKDPISINFSEAELKTVFAFIAESFGINIIFDSDVNNEVITLFAENVTFEQALQLMLATSRTNYKKLGRNTILIYPDNTEKRGQYEDYHIRTFYLRTTEAKKISNLLKSVLSLKNIVVNEEMNAVVIRDKLDKLKLAENLIASNDRKPAEMILDVEILEVNRTKSERLGFEYGSEINVAFDTFPVSGSWSDALKAGVVTLPSFSVNYFKQNVDAKILANPKVRVIDNKTAKIHIGDRVPLRSSTILDATGQTRTTYEYRDIGIRLTVQPEIHLDNSVTVKLGLEVSSLGQNLGTADEPAYSIGTRNSETFMLLRDGETAILGGLIRDEDRGTQVKVPGLGDIPLIGRLFTMDDDEKVRTDVLLTITPRVVRAWELPSQEKRDIYSGTRQDVTSKSLYQFMDDAGASKLPKISMEIPSKEVQARTNNTQKKPIRAASEGMVLQFSEPSYSARSGEEVVVELVAENIPVLPEMNIEVLTNPQFIEGIKAEPGDVLHTDFETKTDSGKGSIALMFKNISTKEDTGKVVIGRVTLKGLKTGVSHLVCKIGEIEDVDGNTYSPTIRGSRINVK